MPRRALRVALGFVLAGAIASLAQACGGGDANIPGGDDGGGADAIANEGGGDDSPNGGDAAPDAPASDAPSGDGAQDAAPDAPSDAGDGGVVACDPITNATFYVDPMNGSDATGVTGSRSSGGRATPGCAFKTVTHALSVIGAPSAATTLIIVGPSVVNAGERFPLVVPANVTVMGQGGAVGVSVPGGAVGFQLTGPSSGLRALTIDGQQSTGVHGVVVAANTASSTTLRGVIVQNFQDSGIRVEDRGVVSIEAAVASRANLRGLHLTGSAHADVKTSTDQTSFNDNRDVGILIDTAASIAIQGTPGTGGAGTVVANGNAAAGIMLASPPGVVAPPQSRIDGLVLWGNGTNGATFFAGTNVVLRGSYVLNNAQHGVLVTAPPGGQNLDLSKIDLGVANGSPGKNTLQAQSSSNGGVGVCLDLPSGVIAATLRAEGNTFDGIDCSMTSAMLSKNACDQGTHVDVGVRGAASAVVSTVMCTN